MLSKTLTIPVFFTHSAYILGAEWLVGPDFRKPHAGGIDKKF